MLQVIDPVEETFSVNATGTRAAADPLFLIATYGPTIYPMAMYNLTLASGEAATVRPVSSGSDERDGDNAGGAGGELGVMRCFRRWGQ